MVIKNGYLTHQLINNGKELINNFENTISTKTSSFVDYSCQAIDNIEDVVSDKVDDIKESFNKTPTTVYESFDKILGKNVYTQRDLSLYENNMDEATYKEFCEADKNLGKQIASLRDERDKEQNKLNDLEMLKADYLDSPNESGFSSSLEYRNYIESQYYDSLELYNFDTKKYEKEIAEIYNKIDEAVNEYEKSNAYNLKSITGYDSIDDLNNDIEKQQSVVNNLSNQIYTAENNLKELPFEYIDFTGYEKSEADIPLFDNYEEYKKCYDLYDFCNYQIASNAGILDGSDIQILFKDRTGMTMADFQKALKVQFLSDANKQKYFFLRKNYPDLAELFLISKADERNQNEAACEVNYYINGLKNNDSTAKNYFETSFEGIGDGLKSYNENINNIFDANGVKSVNAYKSVYMVQELSNNPDLGKNLGTTYSISRGVGEMIPTIAISATASAVFAPLGAATAAGGTTATGAITVGKAATTAVQFTTIAANAYGRSKEEALESGASLKDAKSYASSVASFEALTQMAFGGIENLGGGIGSNIISKTALSSFTRTTSELALNAGAEAIQNVSTVYANEAFRNEFLGKYANKSELYEEAKSAAISGAVMSLAFNISSKSAKYVGGKVIESIDSSKPTKIENEGIIDIEDEKISDYDYESIYESQYEEPISYESAIDMDDITTSSGNELPDYELISSIEFLLKDNKDYTYNDILDDIPNTLEMSDKLKSLNIEGLTDIDAYKLVKIFQDGGIGNFKTDLSEEELLHMCQLTGTNSKYTSDLINKAYDAIAKYEKIIKEYSDYINSGGNDEIYIKKLYYSILKAGETKTNYKSVLEIFSKERYDGLNNIDEILDKEMVEIEKFCDDYNLAPANRPTKEQLKKIILANKGERANLSVPDKYVEAVRDTYYKAKSDTNIEYTDSKGNFKTIKIDEGEYLAFKFVKSSAADSGAVGGFVLGTDQIDVIKRFVEKNHLDIEKEEDMLKIKRFMATDIIAANPEYLSNPKNPISVVVFHGNDLSLDPTNGSEFNAWADYWLPGLVTRTEQYIHEMKVNFDFDKLGVDSKGLKQSYIVQEGNYTKISIEDYIKYVL